LVKEDDGTYYQVGVVSNGYPCDSAEREEGGAGVWARVSMGNGFEFIRSTICDSDKRSANICDASLSPSAAQSASPSSSPPTTISPTPSADIMTKAEEFGFTTLIAALNAAALTHVLTYPPAPGPLTVFAPSNEAFVLLGDELLSCLLKSEYVLVLQNILAYHITYGTVLAEDLQQDHVIMMSNGQDISVEIDGGSVVINGNSKVEVADVMARNGVIHAIDRVLAPPNMDFEAFLEMCLATPTLEPTPVPTPRSKKSSKKANKRLLN